MEDKTTSGLRADHVDTEHVDPAHVDPEHVDPEHVDPRPEDDPFVTCGPEERPAEPPAHVHVRHGFKCLTERRGFPEPRRGSGPFSLWVDASEGVVPLWDRDVILRWRFAVGTLSHFRNPASAGAAIERLLGEAILKWGDAAPVRFTKRDDASADFEIVVSPVDDCEDGACVLASAFFPDGGSHKLRIYPAMFQQTREEQVETLIHEVGHIFGLRHFFAAISETAWAAEVFGEDSRFTIMNYGPDSFLTDQDRADLKRLYQLAWSRELTKVNGTPIKLMRPYHEATFPHRALAIAAASA